MITLIQTGIKSSLILLNGQPIGTMTSNKRGMTNKRTFPLEHQEEILQLFTRMESNRLYPNHPHDKMTDRITMMG